MGKFALVRSLVVTMWRGLNRGSAMANAILRHKFVTYTRTACYFQAFFILSCALWGCWIHLQLQVLTGFAIALLAVAAVVMSVRGELSKPEKIIWVLVAFVLFGLETASLYQDRQQTAQQQDDERRMHEIGFRATANGLETAISNSQQQFAATMNRMGGILRKQDTTLRQTMGGNSYPKFLPTFPVDGSNQMPVSVITPGKFWPHGHIPTPEETAPLLDVSVDVTLHAIRSDDVTIRDFDSLFHPAHYNLGTLIVPGMFTAPFKLEMGRRYTLEITTRRGSFREEIHMDRDANTPGGWRNSLCIYGRQTVYKHGTVTGEEKLLEGHCD